MGIAERSIEDIVAQDSLYRLVTAYTRAVDRRDFVYLRSLYHDEAFEVHGGMFEGGADAYLAFVEKALSAYEMTVHYVVQARFEIRGDRAQGEVHKLNYHRKPAPQSEEIITGSRSLDHYRRDGGVWRFASRSIVLDWARKPKVDPDAYGDFAAASPPGAAGADDASYSILSLFPRHD